MLAGFRPLKRAANMRGGHKMIESEHSSDLMSLRDPEDVRGL